MRYGSGHMHCPLDQDLQLRYPKLWHVSCDKSLNRGLIWRTTHVLQHQILLLCLGRVGGRWKGSFVLLISKITPDSLLQFLLFVYPASFLRIMPQAYRRSLTMPIIRNACRCLVKGGVVCHVISTDSTLRLLHPGPPKGSMYPYSRYLGRKVPI